MEQFLDSLTTERPSAYPQSILTDWSTSERLASDVLIDRIHFRRRYEAAEYLYERLSDSGLREPERDAGLWAWLALFWFDQLCPPDGDGRRRPGERARWIPRIDSARQHYRHLVLGPYLVFVAHADKRNLVEPLLCDSLHTATGEIYRLLIENQRLLTCRAVLAVVRALYYDQEAGKPRRGAGRKGPGGVRRLIAFLDQLDRTYDLHSLSYEGLLRLLPEEFAEFAPAARLA